MTGLRVPRSLAEHLASDPDPARLRWLDQLPGVIAGLCGRWGLELGDPFEPGGQCSWVAPARTTSGGPLVLKVGWSHPEATHEGAALEFWDGNGAVLMHAHEVIGDSIALLLERCVPGTTLSESAGPSPIRTPCCAGCCPGCGASRQPGMSSRPWRRCARPGRTSTSRTRIVSHLIRASSGQGSRLFRGLPATAGLPGTAGPLICTPRTCWRAQREPWLAIDPKPHVGDPAYDPLQHMIDSGSGSAPDPAGLGAADRRIA